MFIYLFFSKSPSDKWALFDDGQTTIEENNIQVPGLCTFRVFYPGVYETTAAARVSIKGARLYIRERRSASGKYYPVELERGTSVNVREKNNTYIQNKDRFARTIIAAQTDE